MGGLASRLRILLRHVWQTKREAGQVDIVAVLTMMMMMTTTVISQDGMPSRWKR